MKKILFITKSMACGGVERTLLNLLEALNKDEYAVDLLLLSKEGAFLDAVPANVRIMEAQMPEKWRVMMAHCHESWKTGFRAIWQQKHYVTALTFAYLKIKGRLSVRFGGGADLFKACSKRIKLPQERYDAVCDYHGYGHLTTYLAARFEDARKFSWIHIEKIDDAFRSARKVYPKFDAFFGVAPRCLSNFAANFPEIPAQRQVLLYNLIPKEQIAELSKQTPAVEYGGEERFLMTSVGRLSTQKGFDLAVETAALLKQRGRQFLWIIVGEGPERENLEKQIVRHGLEKNMVLHGLDNNPYAYMAMADVYVQTSRFEGFATTLSEAVVLEKPIVSTRFSGVEQQVADGENGLLAEFNKEDLAEKLERLMDDEDLRITFARNSRQIQLPTDQTLQTLEQWFR